MKNLEYECLRLMRLHHFPLRPHLARLWMNELHSTNYSDKQVLSAFKRLEKKGFAQEVPIDERGRLYYMKPAKCGAWRLTDCGAEIFKGTPKT